MLNMILFVSFSCTVCILLICLKTSINTRWYLLIIFHMEIIGQVISIMTLERSFDAEIVQYVETQVTCRTRYMMPSGMITAINSGVLKTITPIVHIKLNTQSNIFPSWSGTPKSTLLMSFENLLTILPIGVVSKKDIGPRRTFVRSFSWILLPAFREQTRRVLE